MLASDLCLAWPCTSVPIPQTLGYATIGPTADNGDSLFLNGSRFVTSALGGHAVSMSMYVKGPLDIAGFRKYQLGIYTDVNGRPGTFVAKTAQGTLTANAWNTLKITAALLPNTAYWLMANNNGQGATGVQPLVYTDGLGGASAWSSVSVPFGTWPTTFTATVATATFSIYATLLP